MTFTPKEQHQTAEARFLSVDLVKPSTKIPAICSTCGSRQRGMCGALTPEQLQFLSENSKRETLEANSEIVASEGTVFRYYNITRGVVKLTKLMPDGRQQIVGLQFPDELMGDTFQLHSSVSAETANEVQVCSFPSRIMNELLESSPALGRQLHLQAVRELNEARTTMLMLGRKTAHERVASFLLLLIRNLHLDNRPNSDGPNSQSVTFELPMRRLDMADFLGLTIETVSRQLTKLRKSGMIEISENRFISVPSVSRLEAITGE